MRTSSEGRVQLVAAGQAAAILTTLWLISQLNIRPQTLAEASPQSQANFNHFHQNSQDPQYALNNNNRQPHLQQQQPQQQHLYQQQQHQELSNQFSCGKLYYRTFHMDQQRNVLYVGAMDNIFKLNLANVNKTNCLDDAIRLDPTDTQKCITRGKSETFDCRNHIKVIQPINRAGNSLYVCGTNAYNPRDYLVYANNLSISSDSRHGVGMGAQAECPFDPEDNSTAVWVEHGNPNEAAALYTGTVTDFNKADPLIFRTELYNHTNGQKIQDAKRTSRFDSKALDKPNFVGSFEIGEYVYFFFRESAVEYINCGKSIYSRVARVCKRDNGYKAVNSEKVWTTFLKARLNCSIPGEFPFYFDEIQSIFRNPYDDKKFHAVFTTSGNGLTGSAICSFSLDAFQEAFNGKFKEQLSSGAAWLPVSSPRRSPEEPRAGSCVEDSLQLSESSVNFVRNHPLMDSAVANDNGRPLFYRRDVMFTKLVVDVIEIDGVKYTIYFVGTNTGHVYKIVEWYTPSSMQMAADPYQQQSALGNDQGAYGGSNNMNPGSAQVQSSLVEIIEATYPEPVRAMEISSRHKSLYVASDSQVKQINLMNCRQRHDNCLQCSRDPYCGWDRKSLECRHFSPTDQLNLIQDVTNESPNICHANIKHKEVHVTWGQSVHLPCRFNGFIQEAQDLQQLLASQQQRAHQGLSSNIPTSSQFQFNNLPQNQMVLLNGGAAAAAGQEALTGARHVASQTTTTSITHHGMLQPANYIQWYYHGRGSVMAPGYPVLQRRDKFILAADQGLVIMNANEAGWYQCRLGNQIIYSYNLMIDTKTCAAPNETEFKRIYADWCRETERYKAAFANWHVKQNRCRAVLTANQQHHHQQQQLLLNIHQGQQQQQQQPQLMDHHRDLWTATGHALN